MLKLTKVQKYILTALASVALFLVALAMLAISLIAANQQAAGIKVIF